MSPALIGEHKLKAVLFVQSDLLDPFFYVEVFCSADLLPVSASLVLFSVSIILS